MQGLKGILESHTLHTTHYEFLNDISEITMFRPKIAQLAQAGVCRAYAALAKKPKAVARMEEQGGIDALVERDVQVIVSAEYDVKLAKKISIPPF